MSDGWEAYREAIARRVHARCIDRNLDPASAENTEANCRIEQCLPQLVALARAVGPGDLAAFQAAFERTLCHQCDHFNATLDTCALREQAACCLYRYLPLIYDAIHSVAPLPP